MQLKWTAIVCWLAPGFNSVAPDFGGFVPTLLSPLGVCVCVCGGGILWELVVIPLNFSSARLHINGEKRCWEHLAAEITSGSASAFRAEIKPTRSDQAACAMTPMRSPDRAHYRPRRCTRRAFPRQRACRITSWAATKH